MGINQRKEKKGPFRMQIRLTTQTSTHHWLTWDWDMGGATAAQVWEEKLCEENLDERTAQDTTVPVAMVMTVV